MKSSVFIILSLLLTTAILAPSIVALMEYGEKTAIVIDFNEEEKKEEKKEVNEKDFFLDSDINALALLQREDNNISNFYIEIEYSTSIDIFLLPPEYNV
jgi:hypothetical protein